MVSYPSVTSNNFRTKWRTQWKSVCLSSRSGLPDLSFLFPYREYYQHGGRANYWCESSPGTIRRRFM